MNEVQWQEAVITFVGIEEIDEVNVIVTSVHRVEFEGTPKDFIEFLENKGTVRIVAEERLEAVDDHK